MALARSTIFSFSDEGSGGRRTGGYCRSDVDSSTSLRMTQRTLRMTVASPERLAGLTMAALRPYEVVKMGRRRAAPPGPSSLTREPIWDLRDPGIGVAPRPWVPASAGKTVGGWPPEQAEGSGGRGTGRYCRSDVDSSTSLRMTQRTLRMTVASPERQLLRSE